MNEASSTPAGLVGRIVGWLRAGYPDGVPQQDYIALLGILRRNLTPTEVDRVVRELSEDADAGAAILTPQLVAERIQDVLKGPAASEEVSRVSARLAAVGWPLGPPSSEETEERTGLIGRIVDWLRQGYPTGLPSQDYIPLMALLRRRLSDEEVARVSQDLIESGTLPPDRIDVGAAIAKVTAEMPSDDDVERVRSYLTARGWPTDFPV